MKRSHQLSSMLERVDWTLLAIVALLALIGLANLHSAASAARGVSWHMVQGMWFGFGAVLILLISLVDYRIFERWAYVLFCAVVILLVSVMFLGTEINGSKRWLNLGFFMMQPSELLKLGVILVTARYFHDRNQDRPYSLFQLMVPFALVGLGVILVLKQPDLGTSLVILAIFGTMVLFEGVRWHSILALGLAIMVAIPFAWSFGLKDYQKARVVSFFDLDADRHGQSWQVRQSIIAFGSGQAWGKGHVEGTQIQQGFVPEHENDFVAANWGEEHGFVGMMFLLAVYFAFLVWALRISSTARDRFGAHIGVGVAALFFWHVVVNLGMVTGILPVVGLTLPLLSYGGSSLLTMLAGVGLLLSVSMRRRPLRS